MDGKFSGEIFEWRRETAYFLYFLQRALKRFLTHFLARLVTVGYSKGNGKKRYFNSNQNSVDHCCIRILNGSVKILTQN